MKPAAPVTATRVGPSNMTVKSAVRPGPFATRTYPDEHASIRKLAWLRGPRRDGQGVPAGHTNGGGRGARGRVRRGPDREVACVRRRRQAGGVARQRGHPPLRAKAWCGRGRTGDEGRSRGRAGGDRLRDRRRASVWSRDRGAGLHGPRPARTSRCVGRGRTAGFGLRDRARAIARAQQRYGRGHQGVNELHAFRHLYVHLPFCKHKCGYCDFNAYAGMDRLMPDYVDALERELASGRERHAFEKLETVYLGGGTPSLLPADLMTRLLAFIRVNFDVAEDAEITLEANPASTDATKLAAWLESGVNRLSLGVQGFDGRALAVLERRTDAAQATHAFELARSMGMRNISIDLIYAVPFQNLDSWLETLRRGMALGPDHISTYCLTFEEGTLLWRRRAQRAGRAVE